MDDKYISVTTLKRLLNMKPEEWGTPDERWRPEREIGERIDACPAADVVEVVRCKNCKYRRKWEGEKSYYCGKDNVVILGNLRPNFYCGFGKRRKGND